jgi:hypothetical protein
MSQSVDDAVQAVKVLNPHPSRYARARWVPEKNCYDFPLFTGPISEALAESHVKGKTLLGGVASDDSGFTTSVGLDVDKHLPGQKPREASRRFIRCAEVLNIPVVVHSSKSGVGTHIRTLFKERVPSFLARALYVSLVIAAGINRNSAVDRIWPPTHGLGVLALPYNGRAALEKKGCLALDPHNFEPLSKADQTAAVLGAEKLAKSEVEKILWGMGIKTEQEACIMSGTGLKNDHPGERQIKSGTDGGIQLLVNECLAAKRLRDEARTISYEFWFGMLTNFRPFIGGYEIFRAMSQLDPSRFNVDALDKSWKAVSGGPRMCMNLDHKWKCEKMVSGECIARSPAGLPFAIKRARRGQISST